MKTAESREGPNGTTLKQFLTAMDKLKDALGMLQILISITKEKNRCTHNKCRHIKEVLKRLFR